MIDEGIRFIYYVNDAIKWNLNEHERVCFNNVIFCFCLWWLLIVFFVFVFFFFFHSFWVVHLSIIIFVCVIIIYIMLLFQLSDIWIVVMFFFFYVHVIENNIRVTYCDFRFQFAKKTRISDKVNDLMNITKSWCCCCCFWYEKKKNDMKTREWLWYQTKLGTVWYQSLIQCESVMSWIC